MSTLQPSRPPLSIRRGGQKSRQGVWSQTGGQDDHRRIAPLGVIAGTRRSSDVDDPHVHDERNDAHVGDTVVVLECRPLSRTKRWPASRDPGEAK